MGTNREDIKARGGFTCGEMGFTSPGNPARGNENQFQSGEGNLPLRKKENPFDKITARQKTGRLSGRRRR